MFDIPIPANISMDLRSVVSKLVCSNAKRGGLIARVGGGGRQVSNHGNQSSAPLDFSRGHRTGRVITYALFRRQYIKEEEELLGVTPHEKFQQRQKLYHRSSTELIY